MPRRRLAHNGKKSASVQSATPPELALQGGHFPEPATTEGAGVSLPISMMGDEKSPPSQQRTRRVRNDRGTGDPHVRAAALDLLLVHARTVADQAEQRIKVVNAARRAGLTWDEIAVVLGYGSGDTLRTAHVRAGGQR